MKQLLLALVLFPTLLSAQKNYFISIDGAAHIPSNPSYPGYGIDIDADIEIKDHLYAGFSAGLIKMDPFMKHFFVPVGGNLTYLFPVQEPIMVPFVRLEAGMNIAYEEHFNTSNNQNNIVKGMPHLNGGAGVFLAPKWAIHPFLSADYSNYLFRRTFYQPDHTYSWRQVIYYGRTTLKVGIILHPTLSKLIR
jgi:hypothetical protein